MLIQQRPLAKTPRRRVNQATWATGRAVFSYCAAPRQPRVVLGGLVSRFPYRSYRQIQPACVQLDKFLLHMLRFFICFGLLLFCFLSDFSQRFLCFFSTFSAAAFWRQLTFFVVALHWTLFRPQHTYKHTHTLPRHSRSQIYGFT